MLQERSMFVTPKAKHITIETEKGNIFKNSIKTG